jgi:hypothetical protein
LACGPSCRGDAGRGRTRARVRLGNDPRWGMTGGPHLSASAGAGGSAGCGWRWASGAGLRWAEARGAGKPSREEGGAAADFCLDGLHAKPGRKRGGLRKKEKGFCIFRKDTNK